MALDTGCLWGGKLTAARIDSDEVEIVSVDCAKKEEESVEVEGPALEDEIKENGLS